MIHNASFPFSVKKKQICNFLGGEEVFSFRNIHLGNNCGRWTAEELHKANHDYREKVENEKSTLATNDLHTTSLLTFIRRPICIAASLFTLLSASTHSPEDVQIPSINHGQKYLAVFYEPFTSVNIIFPLAQELNTALIPVYMYEEAVILSFCMDLRIFSPSVWDMKSCMKTDVEDWGWKHLWLTSSSPTCTLLPRKEKASWCDAFSSSQNEWTAVRVMALAASPFRHLFVSRKKNFKNVFQPNI